MHPDRSDLAGGRLGKGRHPAKSAGMSEYSPIVSEFESAEQEASSLRWLQRKVDEARADTRPSIPHDQVMAEIDRIIADAKVKQSSAPA